MSAPETPVECDGRCCTYSDLGLMGNEIAQPDPLCSLHGTISARERDLILLAAFTMHSNALHVGACRQEHCTSPAHMHGTIGQAVDDVLDVVAHTDQRGEVDVKLGEWTRDPDESGEHLLAPGEWGDL